MDPKTFYGSKTFQKLEQALDEIENDEYEQLDSIDLCVLPPDLDELTDTEEFDDDIIEDPNYIPKETSGKIETSITSLYELEEATASDEVSGSLSKEYAEFGKPKWLKTDFPSSATASTMSFDAEMENVKAALRGLSPRQIFEKFLSDEIITYICDQTIIYARQKNNHSFTIDRQEMQTFIAILYLTGYNRLPRERLYWSLDEDLGVACVYNAMSRDRYLEIKKYVHLADNSMIGKSKDRMYKIRPLADKLIEKFCQWGCFHKDISIDESMVKYFGHNPAKQFIRGKPVRFGYKNWMITSSTGYCYGFDVYCGKKPNEIEETKGIPLGAKVVLDLLKNLPEPSRNEIFFDNYFTTYPLMVYLKRKNIKATGTVRENRMKKCPVMESKQMRKMARGTFDYRFDKTNEILCVKWYDNSVCSMLSNYDTIEPLNQVKRWSKISKSKENVVQPKLFASYNSGMGGVDTHDQCISLYRISIKGKKWWWVLFTYFLDMVITNAWKIHQITAENMMDQLEFRRYIVRSYIRDGTASRTQRKRKAGSSVELNQGFHFPGKLEKQLKCCVCHMKARWTCKKCLKTMCIEKGCFEKYHTSA